MAERNFDSERKEQKYHKFTLSGKTYRVFTSMPIVTLRSIQDDSEPGLPLDRTITFIRSMLVPDDRAEFDKLITSPDEYVEAQEILNVSNWIVEVLSGRPTTSPASSGNGAGRTSIGSKAKSSGRGGVTGKK